MKALALNRDAVISWGLAARTWRLEGELADGAALLTVDVPLPCCYGVP